MRLIATESLQPKMKLAEAVYNDKGQILVSPHIELSERMINRLIDRGVTFVYVADERTDDITISRTLTPETKQKALNMITSSFDTVKQQQVLSKAMSIERLGKQFRDIVEDILEEIKHHDDALSMLTEIHSFDSYVFDHSLNVTIYSLGLALALGLSKNQLREIGLGAMLHDIGKMKIPESILNKPGQLTDDEFEMMKNHSEEGYRLLKDIPGFPLVSAHIAYQHHERLDGSGYPRGIEGHEIHLYGKIVAIADVFDAVTSNRVYRAAMLPHEALELLYAGAGTLFDRGMVEAFRNAVAIYPPGLTVKLNDGRKGVVIRTNHEKSDRPVVRILEEEGVAVTPYEVNLLESLTLVIQECETALANKKD